MVFCKGFLCGEMRLLGAYLEITRVVRCQSFARPPSPVLQLSRYLLLHSLSSSNSLLPRELYSQIVSVVHKIRCLRPFFRSKSISFCLLVMFGADRNSGVCEAEFSWWFSLQGFSGAVFCLLAIWWPACFVF